MNGTGGATRGLSIAAAVMLGGVLFVATIGVDARQARTGPLCRVVGTVTGLGTPLPGVSITARRGDVVQTATSTGLDGRFRLDLPEAAYQITIDLYGFDRVRREVTVASAGTSGCEQTLDTTLVLATAPAAAPVSASAAGRSGEPNQAAGGRAGGGFETLTVTQDADTAALDVAALERESQNETTTAPPLLLPPGFGSEAIADVVAINGEAGRVDRGLLNDRRDALNRGDFTLQADPGGAGGFGGGGFGPEGGGPPTLAQLGGAGGPGRGRGGRGGADGAFQLGGRAGRQSRLNVQANYSFSGSALNAAPRQLRSDVAGVERPFSNQQFGITLSGPIKIPALYENANGRTNVTLQFNATRGGNLFDQYATVPTEAMRNGDFSTAGTLLIDPATGLPFPDNQIPDARISPEARALLQYYPLPNLTGDTRNYHFTSSTASTNTSFNLRVQHNFSGTAGGGRGGGGRGGGGGGGGGGRGATRQSNAGQAGQGRRLLLVTPTSVNVNASVQYQRSDGDQLNVFTALGGQRRSTTLGVPVTFNVQRARTQHQFGVTVNHSSSATTNHFGGVSNVSSLIGIGGVSQDSFAWGLPRLSFSSISGLSDVTPSRQTANRYSAQYSWTRPMRRHTVRMGGDFRYDVTSTDTETNANGSFVFTGLYTSNGSNQRVSYADVADFLLGMPQQASIQYGPGNTTLTGRSLGMYVQDDWRARGNLTFQLGVRYDLLWPFVEEHGHLVNLDVTPDFTGAAPVEAGQAGIYSGTFPTALVYTDTNNVSPKLGLAWRGPREFIVRGSYEVNYNNGTYSAIARQLAQQPPFATAGTNIGALSKALLLENALEGIPPSDTRNNFGIDKDYVLGVVQQSVVNVQRALGRTWLASVNYAHTVGSSLDVIRAPNRDATGLRIEGVQPFMWQTADGQSVLNSATFRLERRQTGGVGYSAEYTLAKSRDNSPSIGGGSASSSIAQDDRNIEAEWGLSNFDRRNRLSLNLQAELPFGPGRRWLENGGVAAAILGDWRFTATFTADSGRPYTATVRGASRDIASGVNGALRADYNGIPVTIDDPTIDRYFNTDAFSIPADGLFGTSSRNVIIGPGSKNLNGGVTRDLRLGGNRTVSIQLTASNVLNLANYTGIDTNVNSPTFGQVTGISGSRSARLNLRFRY